LAASTAAGGNVVPCAQGREPDRHRRERKTELEDAIGGAKDGHGRSRDLRPDAVAFHHDDSDRCTHQQISFVSRTRRSV